MSVFLKDNEICVNRNNDFFKFKVEPYQIKNFLV